MVISLGALNVASRPFSDLRLAQRFVIFREALNWYTVPPFARSFPGTPPSPPVTLAKREKGYV